MYEQNYKAKESIPPLLTEAIARDQKRDRKSENEEDEFKQG